MRVTSLLTAEGVSFSRRAVAEKLPVSAAETKTSISPVRLSMAHPVNLFHSHLSIAADYHSSGKAAYSRHPFRAATGPSPRPAPVTL